MTPERKRDLLVYLAGTQTWHALTHLALGITRSKEPHSKLGIKMTPTRNIAAAIVFAGASALLMRFALRPRRVEAGRPDVPRRTQPPVESFAH